MATKKGRARNGCNGWYFLQKQSCITDLLPSCRYSCYCNKAHQSISENIFISNCQQRQKELTSGGRYSCNEVGDSEVRGILHPQYTGQVFVLKSTDPVAYQFFTQKTFQQSTASYALLKRMVYMCC